MDGVKYFYFEDGLNPSDENSALVHRDDFAMNIKLQLFGLVAKQAIFHQLRTVEQLGYITALTQKLIMQSSVKGPEHIDWRVESLWNSFESKLREISEKEFKVRCVNHLKNPRNLKEQYLFYWREIQSGTLEFNRKEAEVAALRYLQKQEFIDFFEEYIKDWSSTEEIVGHKSIWESAFERKGK
ncbi:hypothetical protein IGI04_010734 [Brassica rapa subsp. trilocularis]|uniref:Coenzyme PQQ synthesis protein F-like C-terminal lobe domain-containing protein n=1 Tax=Brassica rapa subsp. trilocularis TaxID=1813537 RepID=A0ABQ7N142_BRACM|nr:hypothetical protein IGI04_010734 [Brassica rapa subsp. trilocularis]